MSVFGLQTMNGLIGMLRANGVIADEKLFETNEGVTSLGEDIFVFVSSLPPSLL